jgi:hypothetical protein
MGKDEANERSEGRKGVDEGDGEGTFKPVGIEWLS